MKEKIKYVYYSDVDSEKEKITVVKNKKNINDVSYKAITKIDGNKYTEVTAQDDGNGLDICVCGEIIRVDYFAMVQLHAIASSIMDEDGYSEWEAYRI